MRLDDVMGIRVESVWTYRDEINDLLDMLENYEAQHGMISGPSECVSRLRAIVRKLD